MSNGHEEIREIVAKAITAHCSGGDLWLCSDLAARDIAARQAPQAEQEAVPQGTASDRYRAELYDEVWERARSMGYGNITEALADLERMKAAPQPEQSAVLERVKLTSKEAKYHSAACVAYWNNAVTACIVALAKHGEKANDE